MSSKTKTTPAKTRTKRPPRLVWIQVWNDGTTAACKFFLSKRAAEEDARPYPICRVAGPYVLAERVRER